MLTCKLKHFMQSGLDFCLTSILIAQLLKYQTDKRYIFSIK